MIECPNLDKLLSPSAVVVIGASDDVSRIGGRPLQLLRHMEYSGAVAGIHPRLREAGGYACYASLADVPFIPDLAIVPVGADNVMPVLAECHARGVAAAVIFAAGFADADTPEGRALQESLSAFAADTGMLILGPNTLGYANFRNGTVGSFASAFIEQPRAPDGRLTLIGQSGGACITVYNGARALGADFASVIMTGNEASLGFIELAAAALADPGVDAVLGYLEGLTDPSAFRALAARSRDLGKPVILYKVGATAAGAAAAQSHTARLSGNGAIFNVAAAELNFVRADTLEDLSALAYLAHICSTGWGTRTGIVTASGALGAVLADMIVLNGGTVPPLSQPLQDQLAATSTRFASRVNPVDLTGSVGAQQVNGVASAFDLLAETAEFDQLVVYATGNVIDTLAPMLIDIRRRHGKPLAVMHTGRCVSRPLLEAAGIPAFTDIARGGMALARLGNWCAALDLPLPALLPAIQGQVFPELQTMLADKIGLLDEHQGKQLLASGGIATVAEQVVQSAAEAQLAADAIGYPVVMKLLSKTIIHKSDADGVRLDIGAANVAATFSALSELGRASGGTGAVLVQRQIGPGVEILLSVSHDALVGPVMMVAAGGVKAELIADTAYSLLPVSRQRALTMLRQLRSYPLLEGYRGGSPCNIEGLLDVMVRLSNLMTDLGDNIQEIEINPVIVSAKDAVAVDAVVRLIGR